MYLTGSDLTRHLRENSARRNFLSLPLSSSYLPPLKHHDLAAIYSSQSQCNLSQLQKIKMADEHTAMDILSY